MRSLRRHLAVLRALFASTVAGSLQYRLDFVLDGVVEVLGAASALVPLVVVFGDRRAVAGWGFGEALVVSAYFTFLKGVIEGLISPSLMAIVEHVRKGTLDFVLIKPVDAQFLVSFSKVSPWRAINVVTALAMLTVAFVELGRAPTGADVAASAALLCSSIAILYGLWMLAVSSAFYLVKVDNIAYLFDSIFDAARWPSSVFRGALAFVFTYVIPLAMMTTFPAEALLGRLTAAHALTSVVGALVVTVVSRLVWLRSLSAYTSASS